LKLFAAYVRNLRIIFAWILTNGSFAVSIAETGTIIQRRAMLVVMLKNRRFIGMIYPTLYIYKRHDLS